MGDEEVRQVGRGKVVESFEGQEEDFEVDALFDGEPVESEENRSDVFTRPGVCEKARSRVLDSIEGMRGDASEEGVAVIKMGQDEGVDKGFSSREGQAVSDFGDAAEVEVGGLNYGTDMGNKGEGGVHDNTKIVGQGGGSDGRGVDGE